MKKSLKIFAERKNEKKTKKIQKNEAIGAKWTDKNYRMLVPVVGLIDG